MVRWQILAAVTLSLALGSMAAQPLVGAVPTEFQPKYDEGYGLGYPLGYKSGLADGKQRGWDTGTTTGKTEGFNSGWSAAYSPAFDLAYDVRFPAGHRAGWSSGVVEGFQEGFDYAPTIAAQILNNWNNGNAPSGGVILTANFGTHWNGSFDGGSSAGSLTISGFVTYDWNRHYFDLGYKEGKTTGFSVGSDEGYELTYPVAYAAGYKIGFGNGVGEGTRDGTRDGREQGYSDGWDQGYDGGFDDGFTAGIDYHLFGEYVEPKYALEYTRRSNALTAGTLRALQAPEPASLVLVSLVVVCGLVRRPGRTRRG